MRFIVTVSQRNFYEYTVEAESEQDAKQEALILFHQQWADCELAPSDRDVPRVAFVDPE